MKRMIFVAMFLAMFASQVCADQITFPNSVPEDKVQYVTQVLTLSADDADEPLEKVLCGGYLFSVEVLSTLDDAMTFTIFSRLGTTIFTTTTTAATSGEIKNPSGYWPMNKTKTTLPTYTLADLGSGTVTIEITVAKQ